MFDPEPQGRVHRSRRPARSAPPSGADAADSIHRRATASRGAAARPCSRGTGRLEGGHDCSNSSPAKLLSASTMKPVRSVPASLSAATSPSEASAKRTAIPLGSHEHTGPEPPEVALMRGAAPAGCPAGGRRALGQLARLPSGYGSGLERASRHEREIEAGRPMHSAISGARHWDQPSPAR
jgi:hypothetical protein